MALLNSAMRAADRIASRRNQLIAKAWGVRSLRQGDWLEKDILALPREEASDLERKGGRILDDPEHGLRTLAKALSAFANSGGGLILLGVDDDGVPSGVTPVVGRTPTKEWLEQKIPRLLDFPLAAFKVATVLRSSPTQIPEGREVIVIEVADSPLAPHQSSKDRLYYHRSGGRSVPAPHFYIELLRNRLTCPELKLRLEDVSEADHWQNESGIFGLLKLTFVIANEGRVAAYKWVLQPRYYRNDRISQDELNELIFINGQIPGNRGASNTVRLEPAILPGCEMSDVHRLAFAIPNDLKEGEGAAELLERLAGGLTIGFQLATETSPGEPVEIALEQKHVVALVAFLKNRYPAAFGAS